MYDDFWAGYNYGNPQKNVYAKTFPAQFTKQPQQQQQGKIVQQVRPGIYDKSKFTKMIGPSGEQGEIYANGKMYIMSGNGKWQTRTFPSRPYGIQYMQKRGWVLA